VQRDKEDYLKRFKRECEDDREIAVSSLQIQLEQAEEKVKRKRERIRELRLLNKRATEKLQTL
jgi:hypothetical protein